MCDAFLPMIKKGGRIVNVASGAGHLDEYSKEAEQKLQDAATSLSKLDALIEEYEHLLEQGEELEAGFRDSAYCTSKAFMVALTKALAEEEKDLLINTCCPGWVDSVSWACRICVVRAESMMCIRTWVVRWESHPRPSKKVQRFPLGLLWAI